MSFQPFHKVQQLVRLESNAALIKISWQCPTVALACAVEERAQCAKAMDGRNELSRPADLVLVPPSDYI